MASVSSRAGRVMTWSKTSALRGDHGDQEQGAEHDPYAVGGQPREGCCERVGKDTHGDAAAVKGREREEVEHRQDDIDVDGVDGLRSNHSPSAAGRKSTVCTSSAAAVASARFIAGPAAATQIMSRRGFRNWLKFTGTLWRSQRETEHASAAAPRAAGACRRDRCAAAD